MENKRKIDTFDDLEKFLKASIKEEYKADLEYEDTDENREIAIQTKAQNLEKLKIIWGLSGKSQEEIAPFFKMVEAISNRLSRDFMVMRMVLSYGTIFSTVDGINSLDVEELWVLIAIMMNLGFDEYGAYGSILSDKRILQMIINTAKDMNEITEIGEQIIDLLDEQLCCDNNNKDAIINREIIIEDVSCLIGGYSHEITK